MIGNPKRNNIEINEQIILDDIVMEKGIHKYILYNSYY